ncbi:hypothetical protein D4T97_005125 [Siminovitchia acidinfaciens]|uniref:Uncharacterized protein n=1 Tax=Siminovitchia acidinfaciens TaxID=2321395 RepID=A0A429Y480_9BACI|nr:hypothetical protein [Siminovitchia acidinfaciens]RST76167.1 hypothetical protein D4T97_005125 [Siminovitchia acidinfaciens]
MIKLGKKQQKKGRKKLIEQKWYRDWSVHFSYIFGVLTIIGLVYGIVSYHQTVKPLVDEKKLKGQVARLEEQNNELNNHNDFLLGEKSNLEKDLSKLEKRKIALENELQNKEEHLLEMQDEIIIANADAYMSPIFHNLLYNSVTSGDINQNVKDITLEKLNELSSSLDITKTQRATLDTLTKFVNEELDQNSDYNDLLGYRVYIYEQKLKDMGFVEDKEK